MKVIVTHDLWLLLQDVAQAGEQLADTTVLEGQEMEESQIHRARHAASQLRRATEELERRLKWEEARL